MDMKDILDAINNSEQIGIVPGKIELEGKVVRRAVEKGLEPLMGQEYNRDVLEDKIKDILKGE